MLKSTKRKLFSLSGLMLVLLAVSSCGTLGTMRAWMKDDSINQERDKKGQVIIYNKAEREPVRDYAVQFALMAVFAKSVYRQDLPEKQRDDLSCSYLKPGATVPTVGMPRSSDGSYGWERWVGLIGDTSFKPCLSHKGLSYETYVFKNKAGQYTKAVIAYRGTENHKGQFGPDWRSNVSAFFGFEPEQYLIAQKELKPLIEGIKKINGSKCDNCVEIYASGHSLGGGLAQQAGYFSEHIKEVFAFDTSPVTNWSKLMLKKDDADDKENSVANNFPTIHRVHHRKEVLDKVRTFTTFFNSLRLNRTDYVFNFENVEFIKSHEMGILACHFSKLLVDNQVDGDHFYPLAEAKKIIASDYAKATDGYVDEHPICTNKYVFNS